MLLIDGAKYEEWTPDNEDAFERIVKEHAQNIFGEESIYLDIKHKLQSKSGIGSIPDGYALILTDQPHWHIVEVELSSHPLYEHIVPQVSKFINGIKSPSTQRDIVDTLYKQIGSDEFLKLRLKRAIGITETYKFLADLISKSPVVTIIIEEHTEQLDEAISALAHSQIKVVEFQTFAREGVGLAVHAHLFEPLYKPAIPIEPQIPLPPMTTGNNVEIPIKKGHIDRAYLFIPAPQFRKGLLPSAGSIQLVTEANIFDATIYVFPSRKEPATIELHNGEKFREWYERLGIVAGDKAAIKVIEPMTKYHLEILKKRKT